MTFKDLLTQVMDWLQQERRVSYRALKVQFGLDDDVLAALKDELIYAKRLAMDEEDRVLVWTGGAEGTPAAPSPQPETPLAILPLLEAERRQVTVLFCDLADSTPLAGQLDPEDWREVVRAYQHTCDAVVQRFDGHIAQLLGDGLLIYFGWPQAHEDDALRAVYTALGMLEAMRPLNRQLEQEKRLHLAIRVGIHTDLVVVGAMGGAGRQEELALGEGPNIASRLQGLATSDTVLLSEATYRLVAGYVTVEDLGIQTLKGVITSGRVYRVLGHSGAQTRLEVTAARGLTPLVGRELEVGLLLDRWAQAMDGSGQVVLLSGEAGIGKSRLVQVLTEQVSSAGTTRVTLRCSPYHTNSALYPVLEHLERVLQFGRDEDPQAKLAKLERSLEASSLPRAQVVPLLAALLALPHPAHYPPLQLSPQRQRQKTHEALVAWLLVETEQAPVLTVWEDLHWADPSSLEVLSLLLDQAPAARMLTILTCRPEFHPPWGTHSHLTLTRLTRPQVAAMVRQIAGGKDVPAAVVEQVMTKTDGVPLFIEELTKVTLESGVLREVEDHYELTGPLLALAIPTTLHDSLMARLDRLGTAKGMGQLGATIGRQFSYELLQAVASLDDATLQRELGRLVAAELLYQRGVPPQSTYMFKHALIQEAAAQSLLKSTRQHYHQRIARVLEERFPEIAAAQPELLAHYYSEAGLTEQALAYWQQAGEHAQQRSANLEAVAHLTKALALLKTLPNSPTSIRQELGLQVALGGVLMTIKGYGVPEAERAYARARELCQHVGETPQLFPVLHGLWWFYFGRAEHQTARELGEQLFRLAQRVQDPALLLQAHRALGISLFYLGELASGHAHFEQGIALYDPQQHGSLTFSAMQNPGVTCLCGVARASWYLGFPDQALARIHEGLSLAQDIAHPFSLAFAQAYSALVRQLRREGHAAQEHAEAALTLSREQGFTFYEAMGMCLGGWSLVVQGQQEKGIEQIRQGIDAYRATGTEVALPYYLALLAEAYAAGGLVAEGLRVLAEALALVDTHGERDYKAELYQLKGELLLTAEGGQEGTRQPWLEAERCFHQALTVARRQQAKSFELRATTSLSRLWQREGKQAAARELLTPIYNWFAEGFDTADLQDARALLRELRE
jgi:predicted ATPase/class 3 adenylate cyclase